MARTVRIAAAVLALAALALLPAGADAAVVWNVDEQALIHDGVGEPNDLRITGVFGYSPWNESRYGNGVVYMMTIEERGSAPLRTTSETPGCEQIATRTVRCTLRRIWTVLADLRGGDDRLVTSLGSDGFAGRVEAYLGAGNDFFEATASATGSNDLVYGSTGSDTIRSGRLADEIHGGDGADYVFAGDDGDLVEGGEGDDKIDGGLADDDLRGQAGHDMIGQLVLEFRCTGAGAYPGTSTCNFEYAFANDPAADGRDSLSGGEGDDRLSIFDRYIDAGPYCGAGSDTLERDPKDSPPIGCETVTHRS